MAQRFAFAHFIHALLKDDTSAAYSKVLAKTHVEELKTFQNEILRYNRDIILQV